MNRSPSPNAAIRPVLGALVKAWPTPRASENENRTTKHQPSVAEGHGRTLSGEAVSGKWPTPRGTDGPKGGPNQAGSSGDLMLPSAVSRWATPQAFDATGISRSPEALEKQLHRGPGAGRGGGSGPRRTSTGNLREDVRLWPTPLAAAATKESPAVENFGDPSLTSLAIRGRWPTPRAAGTTGPDRSNREGGPTLRTAASVWPSPTAKDAASSATSDQAKFPGGTLTDRMRRWATPAARDWRSEKRRANSTTKRWDHARGKPLSAQVDREWGEGGAMRRMVESLSRPAPTMPKDGPTTSPDTRASSLPLKSQTGAEK